MLQPEKKKKTTQNNNIPMEGKISNFFLMQGEIQFAKTNQYWSQFSFQCNNTFLIYNHFQELFMLIKIVYSKEIHVMKTTEAITFAGLEAFIKSVFKKLPAKYTLTYKDNDDDRISLDKDADVKILFESGMNKVKIEIQESHNEDFYDFTQQIVIDQVPTKIEEPEKVEVVEVQVSASEESLETESQISEAKNIDDSINQKICKIIPEIVSKIKEEILNESKISFSKVKKTELEVQTKPQIHRHVRCDECGVKPIVGIRYKCVFCPDFDVCQKCEATSTHVHPFLKIKRVNQAPRKIFVVVDDNQENSLEVNGSKIPLPSFQQDLNLLGGMLGQQVRPENCHRLFDGCMNYIGNFIDNLDKCQKKESRVEIPKPQPKKEQPTEPIKIVEERKQEASKISQESSQLEAANYITEIMNINFKKALAFARNYPELSKEEILMKYLEE